MAVYLGFDSSTQGLTVTAIAVNRGRHDVLFEQSLNFDEALPQYGTRNGVLPRANPRVVHAPPLMWAEALDLMMARVARSGLQLKDIAAISGAAQQHGSVYLAPGAASRLASLEPTQPLAVAVARRSGRVRPSPVWLDSSTSALVRGDHAAAGGAAPWPGGPARAPSSGSPVRRSASSPASSPTAYAATGPRSPGELVHGVAAAGGHAPLEPGDASGMNLMDLATARGGRRTASPPRRPSSRRSCRRSSPSWTIVGTLARYWRERYGFPAARVVAWSGDNPSQPDRPRPGR